MFDAPLAARAGRLLRAGATVFIDSFAAYAALNSSWWSSRSSRGLLPDSLPHSSPTVVTIMP